MLERLKVEEKLSVFFKDFSGVRIQNSKTRSVANCACASYATEPMRHASIDMTTKYGGHSMLSVTRSVNAQIVEMVMAKRERGTVCTPCSLIVSSPFPANLTSRSSSGGERCRSLPRR